MTETVLSIVAAHRAGTATPSQTIARAYARIRAGASLVQLYSAMVYEGPGLARRIAKGLAAHLDREGMSSIAEAVGSG